MLKAVRGLMALAVGIGAFTSNAHATDNFPGSSLGGVFVMSNDASKNAVLAYKRLSDGRLAFQDSFVTGGRGSGGTADPLQSQGSLTLSGDHTLLFAINAGSGTISSFRIVGGLPILVDQQPTGGAEPVAAAEQNGVLYVLNAGGNGAIVAFHTDGSGRLQEISNSLMYLTATASGASSISISPDGKALAVIEKAPDNIDISPFVPTEHLGQSSSITVLPRGRSRRYSHRAES